jgi:hypothetical protein
VHSGAGLVQAARRRPSAQDGGLRIKITCHPAGGGPTEVHEFLAFDRNGDGDGADPDEVVGS